MKEKRYRISKTPEEWKKLLDPEAYRITRHAGTEPAFSGSYCSHKGDGVYHCVCCGSALFDSRSKYDSRSGWPSFWEPCPSQNVEEQTDASLGMVRTEVLCSSCGAHLGHRFPDGPPPTGQRYCINSGALRFEERSQASAK